MRKFNVLHLSAMHRIKYILLFSLWLFFSGCFEIIEEVNFSSVNSGNYKFIANLSKSKTRLEGLMKLDTFMGAKIPKDNDIRYYLDRVNDTLKISSGISNIHTSSDLENFIFTISFDFDKVESLNNAINKIVQISGSNQKIPFQKIFDGNASAFIRLKAPSDSLLTTFPNIKKHLDLIQGASITSIYRFPFEVIHTANSSSLIAKNKKAVMLKQNISEVILNPIKFTNTINTK